MELIHQILRGIIIGVANIIPGVSGGTMMVSMGIYDTLIHCITNIFKSFKKSVLTLLPYGIGIIIGIVGLASILEFLFKNYSLPTSTAFTGLILGGLPPIYKKIDKKKINAGTIGIFIFFFVGIVALSFVGETSNPETLPLTVGNMVIMLFMGCIAAATMIVPGVSGSMVLMLMGYYTPTLSAVSSLKDALFAFDFAGMLNPLAILLPFVVGVAIGVFFVAKAIEWLLHRYPTHTYCAVLGLVLSSPIAILSKTTSTSLDFMTITISVVTLILGFVAAYMLTRHEDKIKNKRDL